MTAENVALLPTRQGIPLAFSAAYETSRDMSLIKRRPIIKTDINSKHKTPTRINKHAHNRGSPSAYSHANTSTESVIPHEITAKYISRNSWHITPHNSRMESRTNPDLLKRSRCDIKSLCQTTTSRSLSLPA